MSEDSILTLIRTLDEQLQKVQDDLSEASRRLLHVRTDYAAARETLDRIARTMGFGRPTEQEPVLFPPEPHFPDLDRMKSRHENQPVTLPISHPDL